MNLALKFYNGKKTKKLSPHEKILCLRTLHTFAFACNRTKPTQRQSQKSAIANALKKGIGLKSIYSLKHHFDFAIL